MGVPRTAAAAMNPAARGGEKGRSMQFLIESPHTKQECLTALDQTLKQGPDTLARFEWGCMSGDHTAYAFVEAESEAAARRMVPEVVRGKARLRPVTRITPQQIESFHKA
jgi:hypothetical protein